MDVREIILGLPDGTTLHLTPSPGTLNVISADPDRTGLDARALCGLIRRLLTTADRGAHQEAPFVRVSIADEEQELQIADDDSEHLRMLTAGRHGALPLVLEAETGPGANDARLDVLLGRIAGAFGVRTPEDLAPALARAPGAPNSRGPSPKETAYLRAHQHAQQLAREVRAIDDRMTESVVPDWLWVAAGFGGFGVFMTAVVLYSPELRVVVVPLMTLLLILGLAAYGARSFRELKVRAELADSRARLRKQREEARAEARRLAATLTEKGIDPDELVSQHGPDEGASQRTPALLYRVRLGDEERAQIAAAGHQTLVFTDEALDDALHFADQGIPAVE